MNKRVLSLILCMCFVITSCSSHKTNSNSIGNSLVDEDKFELLALKTDKQGVDKSTGFQLTSKEKINKKYIKDNLQITPSQEYKIEEVSSTMYNIIPLSNLENDKVYQIKLNDESYDYSWAFQTKKKFEIESTIPSNDSNYVPVNSGIEMYFTLDNLDKIDEFFEISPKVDGKFIQNNNSVVFVPNQLEKNIRYTVTIKKGFGLKDSEQKLEQDFTFTFNTNIEDNSQIYFNSPLTNIYENNVKVIEGYANSLNGDKEYNINIYQYKNADVFATNIISYADTNKILDNVGNNTDIVKINTIKQKPYIKDESYIKKALFQLPEALTKGYYLLEFSIDGYSEKLYHFVQINDMLIYNAFFDNQILVYASDGKTNQGVKSAEVIINDETLSFTNENGILLVDKDTSIYNDTIICMKVKAKGYNDFIYAENSYFNNYYYENLSYSYKYLRYIDTDRPVYLPTDKINVWGFARYRDNQSINKLKVELVEWDTELVLESKYVDLTNIGTYQTEFVLNNITSGNCLINVYDNDIKISTKYISISEYTKPLYTLEGEFNKEFVYSGENINYKINANFFDGYPVSNLEVKFNAYNYSYGNDAEYEAKESNVTLDENGETVVNVDTNLKSNRWRPQTVYIDCYNGTAEDKTVGVNNTFEIFPKRKMLEIEQDDNESQSIDILFHELDNTNYKAKDYNTDYKNLRGKPLNDSINLTIVESYYEKVKKSEHYDFINKVNVIDYDYKLIENTVYSENVYTVDGTSNIKIPNYNYERNYKITALYDDGDGGIYEETYVGDRRYYDDRLYYSIEKDDNKDNYRLDENVNLQLKYDNKNVENIENDKLILLIMRNGLIDYKVTDNTKIEFAFKEDYLPNIMLNGLYIKNGYMYPAEFYDTLRYDRTEKQIYFDVTTDKEVYRPGEEVVLNIKAKDENNKPCSADINISVVDEAYFAVFGKWVNTLDDLYSYEWDTGLIKNYLSNIDLSKDEGSGAEKGGGGGYEDLFRDEFKDTNIFRTIVTDRNGNASMKFKLADNLTSWRITYQAISDKQFAGSGTKNITASLPFYVDLIMGKKYLKEDKICSSLRVFGTEAKASEQVNYEVTVKDKATGKETEYSETGVAGKYTNVFLDKLKEGNYEIYVYASCNGQKDGIKEEFDVVDSSIYFNNTDYYKLTDSTILDEVFSNPVITLFNESDSDFYNSLSSIASSYGKRIDQTVCSMIASKYINEYFKTDLYYSEEELLQEINEYESEGGGFRLLSYSDTDVELTAKLINTVGNDYLNAKTKLYFKNILKNNSDYNTNIAASLWGLSKYKEPVLLTIYDLLENNDLEARDKIYLSLALTELGDNKTAKKYYKEFIDNNVKESGDYLYVDNKTNDLDNYELTALLSILGVKLQNFENSDKLFKYMYHNPSKYTLCNFEQLIYIMNRDIMNLEEIKDLFGEVTVTTDGTKKTYKLKLFDRENFAVTKDKIKDIKFSDVKGSIACKVEALGNKNDLEKNKTEDMSLNIAYTLKGSTKEKMEYNHSDIVKVAVTPSFNQNADSGNYETTYVVPSGFRYVDADMENNSLVQENGQKLTFDIYYNKEYPISYKPIIFYIQAAQKGEYTVDYVVIKEYLENKLNYLNKSYLTVH